MPRVEIEALLKAGVHFGHLTSRWNPKMRPYIFMARNGIHIIDLMQTQALLDEAGDAATRITKQGRDILFVGTKKQAQEIIRGEAERAGMPYVCERWLGGMLTNFQTIRQSIRRMELLAVQQGDGTFDKLKKKERLMRQREQEKLERVLSGIKEMPKLPGGIFVVDIRREHIAVKEARKLDIPVIALVDTNCDPDWVDFPIPANDDALKSIQLLTTTIASAAMEGNKAGKISRANKKAEMEKRTQDAKAEKASA